jgi:hypothetical protein
MLGVADTLMPAQQSAAIGLCRGTFWGTQLALTILSINMISDKINALFVTTIVH